MLKKTNSIRFHTYRYQNQEKQNELDINWNVFKNGEKTAQYDGDWKPKANPGIIDNWVHKN
jgi:hypothetical protein